MKKQVKKAAKKAVVRKPMMKKGGAKKALPKHQSKGPVNTAGQAYMRYVPGATPSDTLGVNDTRFKYPGYAEDTSNWDAKNKMLNMTYGDDTPATAGERPSQSPAAVKAYEEELKKKYNRQKKGGATKAKMAKAGAVVNVGVKANPPVGKRHNLTHTGYESVSKPQMAKGGATKNAKLAAMAAPTNKITRADIITAAKKKKGRIVRTKKK